VQFVLGGVIVVVGLTLIVAGAQGTGTNLYEAVTGKTPLAAQTQSASGSPTADKIATALEQANAGVSPAPSTSNQAVLV
jgi:hypothetical protein